MRLLLRVVIFYLIAVCLINSACAQSGSNMGTEFYTTFADHIYPAALPGNTLAKSSSMVLYIKADQTTTVTIELLGGVSPPAFTVSAGQTYEYQVPPTSFLSDLSNNKLNRAIHITSNNKIAVFAELYGVGGGVGVTSATMLLPVTALGQDYKSLNFTQFSNSLLTTPSEGKSYSFFDVIATADNTTIQVTLPSGVTVYNGDPVLNAQTSAPAQITLNRGDVYQALSDNDLTGARIRVVNSNNTACNPIAVFAGSTKIYIGNSVTNCNIYKTSDNLFQQVTPTATWGSHFITAPLKGRESNLGIYRILFSDVNTNYTINGNVLYQQADKTKGYVEFSSLDALTITADKPIQVAQYTFTQFMVSCPAVFTPGDTGDPDMIYLTPLEQAVNSASFYSTGRYNITNSYINVVMPTAYTNTFKLDGSAVLPAGARFATVSGNVAYSYVQIPVTSGVTSVGGNVNNGSHTISADKPFVATAYGFGTYESYGYSVGANLGKLNLSVAVQDPATNTILSAPACSGKGYTPQLTLPFTVSQITWKVDGTTINVQQNPQPTTTQNNDETLYTYSYLNATANTSLIYFGSAGKHTVTATIKTPYADCEEDVTFDVTTQDAPAPTFTANGSCVADAVVFQLTNPLNNTTVASVSWDFGDNSNSGNLTTNTATHAYNAAGNYSVIVTVNYTNGCSVTSAPVAVSVTNKPTAAFTYSSLNCQGTSVIFTDTSDPKGNTLTWAWDFGDGSSSTMQNPTHNYTNAKTYMVNLIVSNSKGCESDVVKQNITVNPVPLVNITLPGTFCEGDAPVQITTNKNGFIGTEKFTGDGITTDGVFNPAAAGPGSHLINYLFTAQSGCIYTQTFNLSVVAAPAVNTGPDIKILEGESTRLAATATANSLTYKWSPATGLNQDDILNPVASPLNDTKYTLTVTSAGGCTNFSQISVIVLKLPKPTNTFTPNGDGVNDVWYIDQLAKYTDATVNIYTRQGEKVFSSVGYSLPWDGKYNGNDLPVGVYYYIVTLKGSNKVMSGYVTIIR